MEFYCPENVICRICDNKIPANVMSKHIDFCQGKFEMRKELMETEN